MKNWIYKGVQIMKNFLGEFKKFILRGNVLDLAIAVIVGGAFQQIVNSLVQDVISPMLGIFGDIDFSDIVFTVNNVDIKYGAFITAVIQFLLMSFVIFLLLKVVNKITAIGKKEEEKEETTKECTYCFSEIDVKATRCPHCTSVLAAEEPPEQTNQ